MPERARQNIIEIATDEFAEQRLQRSQDRRDRRANEHQQADDLLLLPGQGGLFIAVLEEAYRRIRAIEATLNLDHLEPEAAIRALVGFTFDYQNANEDFIRLVMVENIHKGVHLAKSRVIQEMNVSVINAIRAIYRRGLASGVFRPASTRSTCT